MRWPQKSHTIIPMAINWKLLEWPVAIIVLLFATIIAFALEPRLALRAASFLRLVRERMRR